MTSMAAKQRLILVWIFLLGLTLVTGLAAKALSDFSVMVPVLALASLIKARLILSHYLDLRRAPDWNRAFLAILVALVLAVYGLSFLPIHT